MGCVQTYLHRPGAGTVAIVVLPVRLISCAYTPWRIQQCSGPACASRDLHQGFGVSVGLAYVAYACSRAKGCGLLAQQICNLLWHVSVQEALVELACSRVSWPRFCGLQW